MTAAKPNARSIAGPTTINNSPFCNLSVIKSDHIAGEFVISRDPSDMFRVSHSDLTDLSSISKAAQYNKSNMALRPPPRPGKADDLSLSNYQTIAQTTDQNRQ